MRSSEYDQLMGAEMRAIEDKKGVHSGKDFPAPRIIDASEVNNSLSHTHYQSQAS